MICNNMFSHTESASQSVAFNEKAVGFLCAFSTQAQFVLSQCKYNALIMNQSINATVIHSSFVMNQSIKPVFSRYMFLLCRESSSKSRLRLKVNYQWISRDTAAQKMVFLFVLLHSFPALNAIMGEPVPLRCCSVWRSVQKIYMYAPADAELNCSLMRF